MLMRFVLALLFLLVPFAFAGWLIWSHDRFEVPDRPVQDQSDQRAEEGGSGEGAKTGSPAPAPEPQRCNVPDPAMEACKGTVSAETIRGCASTDVPPPTERQTPIPIITRAFAHCGKRMATEGKEAILPYIDTTLKGIESEFGRASTPYAAALTQIIVLLSSDGEDFEILRPYSEQAVSVAREAYGPNHRETAIYLHTQADVLIALSKKNYAEEAIPLMREAADIRRRVLGADHEETVSAELNLAGLLFAKWQQTENQHANMELLDEVEKLMRHVAAVSGDSSGDAGIGGMETEALLGRIAFAREDYESAVTHFEAAFKGDNAFIALFGCSMDEAACREYAAALRKLGREKEAEAVEEKLGKSPIEVQ